MLTVNELMTVNPFTVTPETSLRRIIEVMNLEGCRHLPVIDDDNLVGIITDRDVRLVRNSPLVLDTVQLDDKLLDNTYAEGIMTADPILVTPETPATKAAELLRLYKFGALPVVADSCNGTKLLVGIVTITDFLAYFQQGDPVLTREGEVIVS